MSDEDDLTVRPYLPDESVDGSLGQASADAPGFVDTSGASPAFPVMDVTPDAVPPAYPVPGYPAPAYPAPSVPLAAPVPAATPAVATYPVPTAYPAPDLSFTLAPFPGSERERPFPSNIKDHFGIAALLCGCASFAILVGGGQIFSSDGAVESMMPLAVLWICLWLVASVAAVILGVTGIKAANRNEASNRGLAITGLVIGGLMIALVMFAVVVGVSSA